MAQRNFVTHEIVGNHFDVPEEYGSLLAIGLGGFGLVWYAGLSCMFCLRNRECTQLGQDWRRIVSCNQEDSQALPDARALQADIPRAHVAQAPSARQRH